MNRIGTSSTQGARVTINDLASALGLAKGTVSRALNGYPDIAESTRLRVSRAAERMGYRPLAQAQAIRTGRARALGLILNTGNADLHRPFLTDFLDGISRAASEETWTLTVATATGTQDEVASMTRLIDDRKADGFILPRAMWDDPRVALCRARGVPFILYGRTGDAADCAWFDISGEHAMQRAVARLAGFGHRRIGFINGSRDYTYAHLRHDGFLAGMEEAGLPVDPALMAEGVLDIAGGEVAGRAVLAHNPTAVVCALDLAALGLYRAAAAMGRTVGQDLAVIAYDGIPEAATAQPPLTTFSVDNRAAGQRLAKLLIARIRGTDPAHLRELAPARLIERASDRLPDFDDTTLNETLA
ncbi:substrate-binding domain-containing protein [Rhodobacteraceae bacterium N5(2021)]|uniref:Substrate-binding domain-containing protein n=1 Tax=Gymnodinialimonas phycosphaerae TaxID=2841589 RepID=A0A975YFT0_9RHOB|nr:substrate-binding domain-containing protein [Gymnodinialimonas phycosphaerae]MBY4895139.1 substrate-binding domain-containing protein [Gymnodinialimonas phycosphaerae]